MKGKRSERSNFLCTPLKRGTFYKCNVEDFCILVFEFTNYYLEEKKLTQLGFLESLFQELFLK